MARRRTLYEGHVWLMRLPDEPENNRLATIGLHHGSIAADLLYLTHDLRLLVQIERETDMYRVRCFPIASTSGSHITGVATSYQGDNLVHILSSAVADYLMVIKHQSDVHFSPREFVRCCP